MTKNYNKEITMILEDILDIIESDKIKSMTNQIIKRINCGLLLTDSEEGKEIYAPYVCAYFKYMSGEDAVINENKLEKHSEWVAKKFASIVKDMKLD